LLIFTSPAEIGLATLLVMIAAIARAARSGILVKGGIYLESLARANAIVFDKTGTLTVGEPAVVDICVSEPVVTQDKLLALAAAIVAKANQAGISVPEPIDFEMRQGRGVKQRVRISRYW
jgi:P-type E1-E2 ATPase